MVWNKRVETTERGFIVVMSLADGIPPRPIPRSLPRQLYPLGYCIQYASTQILVAVATL